MPSLFHLAKPDHPQHKAFQEGRDASANGWDTQASNPYEQGSDDWKAWNRGHNATPHWSAQCVAEGWVQR